MNYTALYRRWRPFTFDEVVGQEGIVRTLKNQIESERIAHAYLFCGSRGTGKTSTAKIFARAINCADLQDGSPCGECDICKKLSSGNNMDIVEIDAASNNGVDEIRDLRDKIKYPPAVGKYKVYIIDEVHMLSTGAFNALLKTLEEPPGYVVFILATTEPHKLPATILSRCQRFDFRRISFVNIVDRLSEIARETDIEIEQEAINTIARWAEGGMRDALSLMDQCIGFSGRVINNADVLAVLGSADQQFIFSVADDIFNSDTSSLLSKIDQLVSEGREISVFLKDIINHLRNVMVSKTCANPKPLLDVADSTLQMYINQSKRVEINRIIRSIEILTALEGELKWSNRPRVLIELALIKITQPEIDNSMQALVDRIEQLEEKISSGNLVMPVDTKIKQETRGYQIKKEVPQDTKRNIKQDTPKEDNAEKDGDAPVEQRDVESSWRDILKNIKKERVAIYSLLGGVKVNSDGKNVYINFPPEQGFYCAAIDKEENRKFIEGLIHRYTGQELKVKCVVNNTDKEPVDDSENEIVKKAIDIFGSDLVEVVEEE